MGAMGHTPTKTVPEVLAEARALLQQRGLHKGSMYPGSRSFAADGTGPTRFDSTMPICLLAACRIADTGNPWTGTAYEAVDALQATLEHQSGRPLGVGPWQDMAERTMDDVLQLIDDTVSRWSAQQRGQDILGLHGGVGGP